ncbi:hypothetical protein [Streptomyces netropsis]|uniref:Uncharacterized protein n=1 Tax=Streptomyces netropsis TaxID=55404 RepID=A0A7W7LFA8_STRNE|nr:hypothetical protein [Streptomyces netropsis]MBB4889155.1 hypothetical protein [Streptomyces netropsis]GGR07596.1 hypothetical protein GCM10010219_09650 [Streptomyces netropsis]
MLIYRSVWFLMNSGNRPPRCCRRSLLSRDNDEERSTVTTLLRKAAAAGQIDPALNPDDTAAWVMALIAALYTSAVTDPSFTAADQLPTLRLILQRFLRPNTYQEPE